jgi:hypothetical protein
MNGSGESAIRVEVPPPPPTQRYIVNLSRTFGGGGGSHSSNPSYRKILKSRAKCKVHKIRGPRYIKYLFAQEENGLLRQRVLELEKKVSDLTATNEFLLDQNAQLRIGGGPLRPSGSMFM